MAVAWRVGSLWLLVTALAAGCGGVRPPEITPSQRVSQHLDDADAFARLGRYAEARDAYATILAAEGPGGDRALLGLARVALDPRNPDRDERGAAWYLDRLLVDYPDSAWAVEGRTWRSLLRSGERLQRDVRRQQQDLERLRRTLHHEQQELVRLRDERERLRQIDVEFERPRLMPSPPTSAQFPRPPESR
jgi:hypothetical protein